MTQNNIALQTLANKLKSLCDKKGREKDLSKTTPILHQMGLLFEQRYEENGIELDLIRGAGLLNAALVRQPKNMKIKQDLDNFCSRVVKMAKANKLSADLVEVSNEVAVQIKEMRVGAEKDLNALKKIPFNTEITLKEVQMQSDKVRDINVLQQIIFIQFADIMEFISNQCVEILREPPCQFTMAGMGSLARKEVTPYSDFESIVVLEEGVQHRENYDEILNYFRWHSVLFQIILVNLKETVLRFLAIPYLNDDSVEGGDWFYDAHTPCGICPDGFAAHACKNPLGRQEPTKNKPWITELIKPVSLMIAYLKTDQQLKNGYYLADVLTRTCYIAGNETVYNEFVEKVEAKLLENKKFTLQQNLESMNRSLIEFKSFERLKNVLTCNNCDIKRMIYRGITMIIAYLGKLYFTLSSSCFDMIQELEQKQIIDKIDGHLLSYAVAVACQVRLKLYSSKDSQHDILGTEYFYNDTDQSILKELISILGEKSLVDYFQITHSVQEALQDEDNIHSPKLNIKYPQHRLFTLLHLFKQNEQVIAKWEQYKETSLDKNVHADEILIRETVASAYESMGLYEEALHVTEWFKLKHFQDADDQCALEIAKVNAEIQKGEILCDNAQYKEAVGLMDQLKPKIPSLPIPETSKHSLLREAEKLTHDCKDKLLQTEEALVCSIAMLEHCENDAKELKHDIIKVNALLRCAFDFKALKKNNKAIKKANEGLQICLKDKIHMELTCICYTILGVCYLENQKYQQALESFVTQLFLLHKHAPKDIRADKMKERLPALIAFCHGEVGGKDEVNIDDIIQKVDETFL
ncbi:unnamed protein product [Clavelina lepadiformis]|uniref:Protein-PII uridylyltransferase N-terminal domain-containing protein n=1 Tax=Clavelina lepadiformis TaxID=159417 RepID=A0ABP0FH42_CLALP